MHMKVNITKEVAGLQKLTVKELQARYAQAFGEETGAHHKAWLIKRIAWRLQALAEGDLSERARQRAKELANDADLRLSPQKLYLSAPSPDRTITSAIDTQGHGRLPISGTVITRQYKGQTLEVQVLPHGFEYAGEVYKSLSAVANAVTGQHCNGFHFFRLGKEATR
jgi:hypothetical protein